VALTCAIPGRMRSARGVEQHAVSLTEPPSNPPPVTARYAVLVDDSAERQAARPNPPQVARAAAAPEPNLAADETARLVPPPADVGALPVRPSAQVEQHRDAIRRVVSEHHAASPRIFGSVARGDDEPGSDVDLLVDFTDEASLLDEIGLRLALADLLHVSVDVVAADTLRGRFRERVLGEAVAV